MLNTSNPDSLLSEISISKCNFTGNIVLQGGACSVSQFRTVLISNNRFLGNQADTGAGVKIVQIFNGTLKDLEFSRNQVITEQLPHFLMLRISFLKNLLYRTIFVKMK